MIWNHAQHNLWALLSPCSSIWFLESFFYRPTQTPPPFRPAQTNTRTIMYAHCTAPPPTQHAAHPNTGMKGNLTTTGSTVVVAVILNVMTIVAYIFFRLWQTYVLRVEAILTTIAIILEALQLLYVAHIRVQSASVPAMPLHCVLNT